MIDLHNKNSKKKESLPWFVARATLLYMALIGSFLLIMTLFTFIFFKRMNYFNT